MYKRQVPKERRITIIATSLIEAGVDLDVYTVFRERSGLDSILQAGGRCNREGRRAIADVFVFDFADYTRTVSYTHLVELNGLNNLQEISFSKGITAICGLNGAGKSTIIAAVKDLLGLNSVSYTHLDVYKRQVLFLQ